MALWFGIALAQVLVLPGHLLTRLLRLDEDGPLATALRTVAFSLVSNYFLAFGLVLLGAHSRPVWLAIVALEAAAGAWLLRRAGPRGPRLSAQLSRYLAEGPDHRPWLLIAALASIAYLASVVPDSFGSVFQRWDAVLSWNRWANDWADGVLPVLTAHYPQLLPLDWSIFYVLQGEFLQFLPHGMMALFPLGITIGLLDLGLRERRDEPLVAIPIVTLLLARGFGPWLGAGLADVPVAFFALFALSPLLSGPFGEDPSRDRARLAASVLGAVGAALTKQPGLYIAGLLPILVWLRLAGREPRARLLAACGAGAATLLAVAPWYGWVQWRVMQGLEPTEMARLDSVIFAQGFVARAVASLREWEQVVPPPLLYPIGLLVLASLARPAIRPVTLLVSLPFPIVWSYFASYDRRNVALALPFLALSAGYGAVWLGAWAVRPVPARFHGRLSAAVFFGLAIVTLSSLVDPTRVRSLHDAELVEVGRPALNRRILDFEKEEGFEGRVLTNYLRGRQLPALRSRFFVNRGATYRTFWPFRGSSEAFARLVGDPANDIRFILVMPPIVSKDVARYVRQRVLAGDYEVAFRIPEGFLLRVRRSGSAAAD